MTPTPVSLESVPFSSIHRAFVEAFSDYAVNVAEVTEQQLSRRARKNGWNPSLSSGVFSGDQLVAITLIGADDINDESIAYDVCTGVVPGSRGRGLAGDMLGHILPMLEMNEVDVLQLEVLRENTAAIQAYTKAGFRKVRGLDCFACKAGSIKMAKCDYRISGTGLEGVSGLFGQLNFSPSYEQRDRALEILQSDLLILGAFDGANCIGAVAFDPQTGWLMRIAVEPEKRRQGVASALLFALGQALGPQTLIKAINIDSRDTASRGLMLNAGFSESHGQWEMRFDLGG